MNKEPPAPYEFSKSEVGEVSFDAGFTPTRAKVPVSLSVGSGLRTVSYNEATGEAILYAVTDRGPNADSPPPLTPTADITATKVFVHASFQPSLLRMSYSPKEGLKILEKISLSENGKKSSGLPIPPGSVGSTGELGLDETFNPLPFDQQGIDPEGLDIDSEGFVWICDEYGPFLMKVDPKTGGILQKFSPGKGLPAVLSQRQPNRGFEGLAIADGKIYGILQSTMDINGETKKVADFIRMVEFDPKTSASRMFAYPIDSTKYAKTSDAKLGDILGLGNGRFAIIEQGKLADNTLHNVLYGIDLKDATDITNLKIAQGPEAGKDLEYTQLALLAEQGIKPLRKVLLSDLRKSGWNREKAEGIAKLNDKTLLIVSDNDFGLKARTQGPSDDIEEYHLDKSQVLFEGEPVSASYEILPFQPATQYMVLKLDCELSAF